MNLKALREILWINKDASLTIRLPNGYFVPAHFHVTEVGRVDKTFIDCGGTKRESSTCLLQVWTADDVDHRLLADKLSKILDLGVKNLGFGDHPVEVEYGSDGISTYKLDSVKVMESGFEFLLANKQTACLAPDKCGVKSCCNGGCC